MLTRGMMSSDKDCWETPQSLYDQLDELFHFTLDPCSTHENAKCAKHYTKEDDGLSLSWKGETVFCNPPYGNASKRWIAKCAEESRHATVVALLPARTDTKAFHEHIYMKPSVHVLFLRGRLKFELGGVSQGPAPFPSMLVSFGELTEEQSLFMSGACEE